MLGLQTADQSCPSEGFPTGEIEQFAIWFVPAIVILLINSIIGTITVATMGYRICCTEGVRKVQPTIEERGKDCFSGRHKNHTL